MSASIHPVRRWSRWALAPIIVAAAATSAPFLLTRGYPMIAFSLQHAFSLVCHQRPERSFWICGAPIAVCSRCLGIYLGAAVGLVWRTSRRVALQLLIAAAALNILDWLTEAAGLHGNWMTVRLVFGLTLGATAALLVSSSMAEPPSGRPADSYREPIAAGFSVH